MRKSENIIIFEAAVPTLHTSTTTGASLQPMAEGQLTYTGLRLEAVPIHEFVTKIEKKECTPRDMQRWLISDTAMVFDGGVSRSSYVAPTKGADWQGAELFTRADEARFSMISVPWAKSRGMLV